MTFEGVRQSYWPTKNPCSFSSGPDRESIATVAASPVVVRITFPLSSWGPRFLGAEESLRFPIPADRRSVNGAGASHADTARKLISRQAKCPLTTRSLSHAVQAQSSDVTARTHLGYADYTCACPTNLKPGTALFPWVSLPELSKFALSHAVTEGLSWHVHARKEPLICSSRRKSTKLK